MYRPSVGEWALGAVLLYVHAKEAHIYTVNLLKGKKCFGSVGKGLGHFTRVHKPVVIRRKQICQMCQQHNGDLLLVGEAITFSDILSAMLGICSESQNTVLHVITGLFNPGYKTCPLHT